MSATTEAPPRATCRLTVTPARYLVRWASDDAETFAAIVTDFRATFPRHNLAVWRTAEKCWSVPRRHHARLMEWLAGWFPGDALELEDGDEEQAGTLPPMNGRAVELERAYAALYLLPGAPPALVQAAYRTLARLYHPDAGGTHDAMTTLNSAYEYLKEARP